MTRTRATRQSPVLLQFCFAAATLLLTVLASAELGLRVFGAYLAAINLSTFVLYAYDKWGASRAWTRIPEQTLHLFELLGGSPAAFIAQTLLHHKNRKKPFQIRFWIIVGIQAVVVLLCRGYAW